MSEEEYVEYEVRSAPKNSRKYYNAVFPADPSPTLDDKPTSNFPPFSKQWSAPVYLHEEDTSIVVSDNESEDEDAPARPFKRRRYIKSREDSQWVLTDKKGKNKLVGTATNLQNSRYFVMVPPQDASCFRVYPVEDWIAMIQPPKYKPLTGKEARELQGRSSMRAISSFLDKKRNEEEERSHQEPSHKFVDELEMSDDDRDTKKTSKAKNHNVLEDDDDHASSAEEDLDVMAIDRQPKNRGEGAEEADYDQEFQDDEDDGKVIGEENLQVENEDEMIKGAEELLGAESDSSSSEFDEQAADDDDNDVAATNTGTPTLETPPLMKVIKEVPETEAPKQQVRVTTSPIEKLQKELIDTLRRNGGTMVVAKLYKHIKSKKVTEKVGMTKEEAEKKSLGLIKEIADLIKDEITNRLNATLRQAYA